MAPIADDRPILVVPEVPPPDSCSAAKLGGRSITTSSVADKRFRCVLIPAGGPIMKWQEAVADEVSGDRGRRGRMGAHQLLVFGKHGAHNSVGKIAGQIAPRHGEI